jgi:hypothetical protein
MIPIKDTIAADVSHQDDGFGHSSSHLNVPAAAQESGLSVCDVCARGIPPIEVCADDPMYAIYSVWVKACISEGKITPLPSELADCFDRMMVEVIEPDPECR